uniref:Uncharacterized protein n=1 Tax=Anguilla anguilla TaxID=7936 RepID=A0A0E9UA15_ANGAN
MVWYQILTVPVLVPNDGT